MATQIQSMADFHKGLQSVLRRSKTLRSDVQKLLEYSFDQFSEHGNAGCLERLLLGAKSVRTIRTSTLEAYIFHHANVEWKGKGKDARLVKIKNQDIKVLEREMPWYEFNNEGIDMPEVDLIGRFNSLQKVMEKVQNEKATLKNGEADIKMMELLTEAMDSVATSYELWQAEQEATALEKAA